MEALGGALISLMHERSFDDITVQDILDRAGVARATFYAHYRNKEDVLDSAYEQLFAIVAHWLTRAPASKQHRLFPVAEFLGHLDGAQVLLDRLQAAGRLESFFQLTAGFATKMIVDGTRRSPAPGGVAYPTLCARMLAASLVEMTQWWLGRQERPSADEMDDLFHVAAGNFLRGMPTASRDTPAGDAGPSFR